MRRCTGVSVTYSPPHGATVHMQDSKAVTALLSCTFYCTLKQKLLGQLTAALTIFVLMKSKYVSK